LARDSAFDTAPFVVDMAVPALDVAVFVSPEVSAPTFAEPLPFACAGPVLAAAVPPADAFEGTSPPAVPSAPVARLSPIVSAPLAPPCALDAPDCTTPVAGAVPSVVLP
jgi:hypothetical protein